ncbi:MAG: shikimate dehydrogenase family protein [Flavobacteriaceae bacterium]
MGIQKDTQHKTYGLVGKNISYSFSKNYFSKKFSAEHINNCSYVNFDIDAVQHFKSIFETESVINGLNVTIPYKEAIIPHLDKISKKAQEIGAVNTIKVTKEGQLKGYNTDEYGFRKSLLPLLQKHHNKALILGTGGASKAIAYALKKLQTPYSFVSRKNNTKYNYESLTDAVIKEHHIIINCTPLGTFPKTEEHPNIPYNAISNQHLLYDLIYNPEETTFLQKGRNQGAATCNGMKMLELQAEKAWKIWNK